MSVPPKFLGQLPHFTPSPIPAPMHSNMSKISSNVFVVGVLVWDWGVTRGLSLYSNHLPPKKITFIPLNAEIIQFVFSVSKIRSFIF